MKTKLLSIFSLLLGSMALSAQTNSITVTSTLPTTIEVGQTITVEYEYTLAENPTDQQIKVGFNEVTAEGGYVGNGDAAYSGGLGIGATTGTVTGSMSFTITKPASSTLAAGNKYTYDISIQENGGSYTTYASAAENGTELTVNEASGVINAISVTSTLPNTAAQAETFTIEVDYSSTEDGMIQVGLADQGSDDESNQWAWNGWLVDSYVNITATTGTLQQSIDVTVPEDAPLSSTLTGLRRYRILVNLLDATYATLASASTVVDPFTVTESLGVQQANANGISIYPNPVSDKLMINNKRLNAHKIILSDVMGRTVKQIDNAQNVTSINVSQLSKGIYILTTDNKKIFKFIKE